VLRAIEPRAYIAPQARALLQAARQQQLNLAQIAANLPAHLPSNQHGAAIAGAKPAPGDATAAAAAAAAAVQRRTAAAPAAGATAAGAGDDAVGTAARRRDALGGTGSGSFSSIVAPRWYVTQAELSSLATYMRGRLTLERVRHLTLRRSLCPFPFAGTPSDESR
jgi:hypothetical protein